MGRRYGQNPYAGYDRVDNPPFLFDGAIDGRLLPKERVVTVTISDVEAAFPFSVLAKEGTINYNVGGTDLPSSSNPAPVLPWTPVISPIPIRSGRPGSLRPPLKEPNISSRTKATKLWTTRPAVFGVSKVRPSRDPWPERS
ncbi:MAG: hypothetical protein COB68_04415 [SAR202 cluster bacterium]|nr:MAG: hypothetical protein COB68_04415 [SAR202 cluster bacterium]